MNAATPTVAVVIPPYLAITSYVFVTIGESGAVAGVASAIATISAVPHSFDNSDNAVRVSVVHAVT